MARARKTNFGSLSVAQLAPDVFSGNRRFRMLEMFRPPAIELGSLLGTESQLRVTLIVAQAFPESDGELGTLVGRKIQQVSEVARCHALIFSRSSTRGKDGRPARRLGEVRDREFPPITTMAACGNRPCHRSGL